MAANQYRIYVPDRSDPFFLPKSMTDQDIRATLVANGHTACETAELCKSGDDIRFRRLSGGTKGVSA